MFHTIAVSQGHTISDRDIPNSQEAQVALETANRLNARSLLTRKDMLQMYYTEIKIGRCVWGISPKITDSELIRELKMVSHLRDTSIGAECVLYVQNHQQSFSVVDDGFKGEENFWEPNSYWLERIKSEYPHSKESLEIEFDLEFTQLVRRFHIDLDARGKTCSQYWAEELARNREVYLEVYSQDDIKRWVPECEDVRKSFESTKTKLLQKYDHASFTKKLQEIDTTAIVVFHSVE